MDTLLGRRRSFGVLGLLAAAILLVAALLLFFRWFNLGRVGESAAVQVVTEAETAVIGPGPPRTVDDPNDRPGRDATRATLVINGGGAGEKRFEPTTSVRPTSTTTPSVAKRPSSPAIAPGTPKGPQSVPSPTTAKPRTGTPSAQATSNTVPKVVPTTAVLTTEPSDASSAAGAGTNGSSNDGAGSAAAPVASVPATTRATPTTVVVVQLPLPPTPLGSFDFGSKTYRDVCDDVLDVKEFTLDQGVWADATTSRAVTLLGTQYADFTGDGTPEAVVSIRCEDLTSRYAQFEHYVYRQSEDGSPSLLYGRAFKAESVSIVLDNEGEYLATGGMWVRKRDYSGPPGTYISSRWAWNGTAFVEVEAPAQASLVQASEGAAISELASG